MQTVETAETTNLLRLGLPRARMAAPCAMVIFGATGDLTRRKLVPALYNLARAGHLPPEFSVVGFARSAEEDAAFREELRLGVAEFSRTGIEDDTWQPFAAGITSLKAGYDDPAGYRQLGERLEALDRERGTAGNRLFYLATPPNVTASIATRLGEAGLVHPQGGDGPWTRIVIEKPFGHDLGSAHALNEAVGAVFPEEQVFRIDHYLGKETVQNILVLRFANALFEPLWNGQQIDHVQITVSESVGVEGRGGYFEQSGILRDMVQNHLLQLLCLVAMEPPVALEADAIRGEKVQVLRALRPIRPNEVTKNTVRAQYRAGWVLGKEVPGYREEEGVSPTSTVETYAALRVWIDNWRWAGVPFYLRAGKRLPKRTTEIAIQFKAVPRILYNRDGDAPLEPNVLSLRIQPNEGIALRIGVKVPGHAARIQPVTMDFGYGAAFGVEPPEAYERLILDALLGDSTLFTRRDEVEAQWEFITPILDGWASAAPEGLNTENTETRRGNRAGMGLAEYEAGTWGPAEADELLLADGRHWRRL
jgi:glucose-6-phosphate 1-dehydrogenase